jgi:hypothetical protein
MDVIVEPDWRLWAQAAELSAFWPLQQDWDYGLAVRWQAQPVLRLLARDDAGPVACVQLVGRRCCAQLRGRPEGGRVAAGAGDQRRGAGQRLGTSPLAFWRA